TFSEFRIPVPRYLLNEPQYNGGADKQYRVKDRDEEHAVVDGRMVRRWDPAVQERFHKLLFVWEKSSTDGLKVLTSRRHPGDSARADDSFPKGSHLKLIATQSSGICGPCGRHFRSRW